MTAVRPKPLIAVREAAEILGVGTTTAYEWLRRGELPGAVQHGGRWYVRRAVVEAYAQGADVLGERPTAHIVGHKEARPTGRASGEGR